MVLLATSSSATKTPSSKFKLVKFTVDAELLRELGERLVGKPYIALGELVKNSYDADATECVIRFGDDEIRVSDNGNGMSHEEFVRKWMRVGSTHKTYEKTSPKFKRQLTGSKGVGRLSAQFLGSRIEIISVARDSRKNAVRAKLSWPDAYGKTSLVEAGAFVREESRNSASGHKYRHGTTIRINGLKEVWGTTLLKNLATELWFLQPPPVLASDLEKREQFEISVEGVDEIDSMLFATQTEAALENWIAKLEGEITNGRRGEQVKLTLTFRGEKPIRTEFKLQNNALDEARFGVFVFKLTGRQASGIPVEEARDYFRKFGGLHIYDAGFRLPYYGGDENDWLGLEIAHSHRLVVSKIIPEELRLPSSSLQDLPTLGRVLGVVQISTPHEADVQPEDGLPGDLLQVQITRDKLIENRAYEDLVYLVRWAFDFYSYQSTARRARQLAEFTERSTPDVDLHLDIVRQKVEELKDKVPPQLVKPLQHSVERFAESEQKRQRAIDAERVLLGSLATAGMGAIALQHELAKELGTLERVVRRLESHSSAEESGELSELISALKSWLTMASQTRKMFSPLFDQVDREKISRVRVKRVIEKLSSNLAPLLRGIEVETDSIPPNLRLPAGTMAGWNAVFQNILVNAVNAMLNSKSKRIRCRASVSSNGKARLVVEDTGVGVDVESSEKYFKPFIRKLDLPEDRKALGLGGMGIGLTIVKMVCETFGCTTAFVKPKSPFKTAFEISWRN